MKYLVPVGILSTLYSTLIFAYHHIVTLYGLVIIQETCINYICCKNQPFASQAKLNGLTTSPYYLEEIGNLTSLILIKFKLYALCKISTAIFFPIISTCSFKLMNKYIIMTLVVRVIFISFLIILQCAHSVYKLKVHFYETH